MSFKIFAVVFVVIAVLGISYGAWTLRVANDKWVIKEALKEFYLEGGCK